MSAGAIPVSFSAPPTRPAAAAPTESPAMQRTMTAPARLHQDALQFRLILAATYPFFLVAALVQRVLPGSGAAHRGLRPVRRSVFGEAKAMAVSAIPFVFMG